MSNIVVADQAHNIVSGVGHYLPDLDIRLQGWRSAIEAMPVVPERDLKAAMAKAISTVQVLPKTKEPMSQPDGLAAQAAMHSLSTALQNVYWIHQHNTEKAQELRERFIAEEATLLSQLETLGRQAGQVSSERNIIHNNMADLLDHITLENSKVHQLETEIAAEIGHVKSSGGIIVPFMTRGMIDSHRVYVLEKEIKMVRAEIENSRNAIQASEASQDDRNQFLERISSARSEVSQRKPTVTKVQTQCEQFLDAALPRLQSLEEAVKTIDKYANVKYGFENMDVIGMYDALLKVVRKAVVCRAAVDEGAQVVKIVMALPFASELTQSLEATHQALNTVSDGSLS